MSEPIGRRLRLSLAVAASAAVAGALLAPLPPSEALPPAFAIPHLDKLVHVLLFGGLAASWRWAGASFDVPPGRLALFLTMVGYGALLELVQGLAGDRSVDLWDALANSLGIALVMLPARRPPHPARTPVDSR